MSLPVIGYFPNSDNNLAPLGAKVTALGGTAQGQNHSQKSLKRAAFKTHVSSLHSLMHDFFFSFGVGEKTAISWREGQLKWLVWPLGKCPLLISRLSPVGGSQNKRWVGPIFSHPKVNTRACAHWEEQTESPLRFISQSSPAFSTYNLIWAWQTLLVTYPTSILPFLLINRIPLCGKTVTSSV